MDHTSKFGLFKPHQSGDETRRKVDCNFLISNRQSTERLVYIKTGPND